MGWGRTGNTVGGRRLQASAASNWVTSGKSLPLGTALSSFTEVGREADEIRVLRTHRLWETIKQAILPSCRSGGTFVSPGRQDPLQV